MGTMRQFAEALAVGDAATLGALLSLGCKHTDRVGKLWRREEWLARVRPNERPPGALDFGHATALLMRDLGIVTGIKHLHIAGAKQG